LAKSASIVAVDSAGNSAMQSEMERRCGSGAWIKATFSAVLDHDLRTGADPRQQPSEVAGRLRFRDVDHMVSHEVIKALSGYENGWQHRSHPFAKNAKGWGTRLVGRHCDFLQLQILQGADNLVHLFA
jgi:hypothetical protein